VPGTVAGLALALRTFGTMPLAEVMSPAIKLASDGFPVSEKLATSLHDSKSRLARFPESHKIFLKNGSGYRAGETLRQAELAATLRRIAKNGPAEFYSGKTGKRLAAQMSRNGGLLTLDDLEHYRPKIRDVLRADYGFNGNNWEVIASPPPSSGGIAIIEALNILGPVKLVGWDNAESVHWVVEAMRRVFADRAAYLADSDFVPVPVRGLTDPRYAARLGAEIDPENAQPSSAVSAGNPLPFNDVRPADSNNNEEVSMNRAAAVREMEKEAQRSGHTTHFSVVDAAGNAVANTYTLNDSYGSGVTTSTGFLLNDEMDDFTTNPGSPNMYGLIQSEKNAVGPGKRPLSAMSPTMLLREGKLSFVTGSPGGPRIISATLLSILNWMRLGMDAQAAINAPRFHHQWMPDVLWVEPGFSEATATELEQRGYKIERRDTVGEVEAIGIDPKTGERLGAPDGRREGVAVGY
jgi:gamma-glutamyltranspeptidase / glutathione hydrolase